MFFKKKSWVSITNIGSGNGVKNSIIYGKFADNWKIIFTISIIGTLRQFKLISTYNLDNQWI